jgi:bla regulator protein BlaR1
MSFPNLNSAFELLLQTSLGASLLIGCALLIRFAFRKWLPVHALYILSVLVLLRLALPVFPASEFSLLQLASDSDLGTTGAIVGTSAGPVSGSALQAAASVWASGLTILVGYLLVSYWRLRRWLRLQPRAKDAKLLRLVDRCRKRVGVEMEVPVHVVDRMRTPAVFGFLKPRILIPDRLIAQLDDHDLKHVLLHELSHIRRHDMLMGTAATLVAVVHWFNPLVWIVVRKFANEREILCDRAVLESLSCDSDGEHAYGSTLIRMLSLLSSPVSRTPGLVPMLTNKGEIKERIRSLVNPRATRPTNRLVGAVVLSVLGLIGFTVAAPPETVRKETERFDHGEIGVEDHVDYSDGREHTGEDPDENGISEMHDHWSDGEDENEDREHSGIREHHAKEEHRGGEHRERHDRERERHREHSGSD